MARFVVNPNLHQALARIVTPVVEQVAVEVTVEARATAPDLKDWVSMRDERVRHTHVKADEEQTGIPANLRFTLDSMQWDREHRGVGEHTYMRFPKDETSRAVANLLNCRCIVKVTPHGMAEWVGRTAPVRNPDNVTVTVYAEGAQLIESEFGTVYEGDLVADGTFWLGRSARTVAARRRRGRR